jgi:hypothetical protein
MYWMKWGEEMVSLPVRVVAVVTAACASFPTNNWSLKDSSLFQLRHQWWMWNLVDSIFPRTKETELVKAWSHVAVPIQKFVCVCFFFFFTSNIPPWVDSNSSFNHRFPCPSGGLPFQEPNQNVYPFPPPLNARKK